MSNNRTQWSLSINDLTPKNWWHRVYWIIGFILMDCISFCMVYLSQKLTLSLWGGPKDAHLWMPPTRPMDDTQRCWLIKCLLSPVSSKNWIGDSCGNNQRTLVAKPDITTYRHYDHVKESSAEAVPLKQESDFLFNLEQVQTLKQNNCHLTIEIRKSCNILSWFRFIN